MVIDRDPAIDLKFTYKHKNKFYSGTLKYMLHLVLEIHPLGKMANTSSTLHLV